MAYLNAQERDKLKNELKNMNFNKAKGKLHRLDNKGRLVYFRNNQSVNQWATRFELPGLGTRVTLVESQGTSESRGKFKSEYVLVDVVVEATPDNRT